MLDLTDEQIDEAALRMAMADMKDEATEDDGIPWTRRGMRARAAAGEFSASLIDPATALSRAWEAASDEGQVVS